ncbi:MAG: cytochrome c [Nitrospirota bacterium]|nr:cytochrome c [Nitrospirota bacterium]
MKKGENVVWGVAGLITLAAVGMGYVAYNAPPQVMPTYQLDSPAAARGEMVYREQGCSSCHKIWDLGSSRGGPLDGIGSRRDAEWLSRYLGAENPQILLPSTRKRIYQMPSFAHVPEDRRADLVAYLSSLKERAIEEAHAAAATAGEPLPGGPAGAANSSASSASSASGAAPDPAPENHHD